MSDNCGNERATCKIKLRVISIMKMKMQDSSATMLYVLLNQTLVTTNVLNVNFVNKSNNIKFYTVPRDVCYHLLK